ncbi:hypothetical protein BDW22DRAFT_1376706 [Trametopsis cervina]|nr:hypothetical protein BDW22DRAFT_1376706 [Trametopsis cervina]
MPQGHEIGLAYLPTELYDNIVGHLEASTEDRREFQHSLLSLSRAIPRAPLSLHALFRQIILSTPKQAQTLFMRLVRDRRPAKLVEVFRYECFVADADIIINLLALLPSVTILTLFIGPNFAPSHLENLLETPRTNLKKLKLRFRPYVSRANYHQFMAGVYFDSTLTHLSTWPRSSIPTVSIVQDPFDSTSLTFNFAQPLVFFGLNPISELSASPFASSITSLRFRLPARKVAAYLHKNQNSLPSVTLLDISTCAVSESEVEALLVSLEGIQGLLLDGCPIVTQRADAMEVEGAEALGQWKTLGKTLALVGARRARERERKIRVWLEQQESTAHAGTSAGSQQSVVKKTKTGRKGVANATFLLRATTSDTTQDTILPNPTPHTILPNPTPPSETTRNKKTKDVHPPAKSKPPGSKKKWEAKPSKPKNPPRKPASIRITPSSSALRCIALTAPMASVDDANFAEKYEMIKREFQAGWSDGTRQLIMTRDRMKATWSTGTARVMIDKPRKSREASDTEEQTSDHSDSQDGDSTEGAGSDSSSISVAVQRSEFKSQLRQFLVGLTEATSFDSFALDLKTVECPVLCLAGPKKSALHAEGCVHQSSWAVWGDEL